LLVLGGLGLGFLRSHVNLSILGDSQKLAESRRTVAASERDVDRVRMSVERLAAIDRIEPEARRSGFERPPAEAVMLLSARASEPPIPEARPLGVPGAGALGRWLERAAKAARVPAAAAEPGEGGRRLGRFSRRDRAGERDPAPDRASLVAAARGFHAGEHGERGSRCDHCRALAAGQTSGH
jgi:hypothetical protein